MKAGSLKELVLYEVRRGFGSLASVAALCLAASAGAALAKPPPKPSTRPAPAQLPVEDDGLGPNDILLQADSMIDDDKEHTYTALGNAEARYQGRLIRAKKIIYNSETGATHAIGDVIILNPDRTMEFGQDVELDKGMNAAVALAFSARSQDNVTITAGAAIRRSENVRELNHGEYTPCKACLSDGSGKTPTFSIQADRILEDHARQIVYYRNAIIRVKGLPVFYAPIFWHPDPEAVRQSGLLAPKIWTQAKRGLSIEQPYLWVLSPSADLTIAPQINEKVNPFLNLHFRERFYSGQLDIRAGYTYERNFNSDIQYGKETSRSYILGSGSFDLTPQWSWGFGAERVTDGAMFWRYSLRDIYSDRGDFSADTARLISQLFTSREDDNSFLSVAAINFQSIRPIGSAAITDASGKPVLVNGTPYSQLVYEKASTFPTVAPLIDGRYDHWLLGGRFDLGFNAVMLTRADPVIAVLDPNGVVPQGAESAATIQSQTLSGPLKGLQYTDSRSVGLNLHWSSTLTFPIGLRVSPFLQGEGEFYSISDGERISVAPGGVITRLGSANSTTGVGFGQAGADISYPLYRPIGAAGSIILEPLVQAVLAPKSRINANVPNEDSTAVDFDDTNLFSVSRFPGVDLQDGGDKLNLAGRATIDLGNNRTGSFLVGRSYSDQINIAFTPNSGLRTYASDWITYDQVSPFTGFSLFYRGRFSSDNLTAKRIETGFNVSYGALSGSFRYDSNADGLSYIVHGTAPDLTYSTVLGRTEDMSVNGTYFLNKNWGMSTNVSRDMHDRLFPQAQLGLIYKDDCIRLDLIYSHDQTFQGNGLKPLTGDSIAFRLTLAAFGNTAMVGAPHNDSR